MKSDAEVVESRDDAEMIRRPQLWPNLVLFMKRGKLGHPSFQSGVIYEDITDDLKEQFSLGGVTVIHLFASDLMAPKGGAVTRLESGDFTTYEDAAAVVADGWVVD